MPKKAQAAHDRLVGFFVRRYIFSGEVGSGGNLRVVAVRHESS